MHFDVVTLFPSIFDAITQYGVTGRAFTQGAAHIHFYNPRDYADSKHGHVDDRPYGGGPGMVMQVPPLRRAIQATQKNARAPVLYLSPQGERLTQAKVQQLAQQPRLVLLAGRYEGIDERVIEHDVDEEISLGDFILTGGEYAAICLIDAIVRLLPGVLGCESSAELESFAHGRLEHPQYTRPESIDGQNVPPILLQGDHAAIAKYRAQQSLLKTYWKRPDLLVQYPLSEAERAWLEAYLKNGQMK